MELTLITHNVVEAGWTLQDFLTGRHWNVPTAEAVNFQEIDWDWYYEFMDAMTCCMYANRATSLSAPQVGVNKQIFLYDTGNPDPWDRKEDEIQMNGEGHLINAHIMSYGGPVVSAYERCASIPDHLFLIERPAEVVVSGYYKSTCGLSQTSIHAGGYLARVLQHEIEHMSGDCFTRQAKGVQGVR